MNSRQESLFDFRVSSPPCRGEGVAVAVISHNPLPYEVKACMALLLERSLCQRFRCCVSTLRRLVMTAIANPDASKLSLHRGFTRLVFFVSLIAPTITRFGQHFPAESYQALAVSFSEAAAPLRASFSGRNLSSVQKK